MGLLLLCALLAYDVIRSGIRKLLHPGFNLHTLITLELGVSLTDGCFALASGRTTYCPLVCLLLAAALWGLLLEDRATCAAMDTARKSSGELALVREPNLFQKLPGVLPGTGSQEEFLKSNQLPAKPVRLLEGYALAVFLLSAAVAGLTCRGSTAAYFNTGPPCSWAGTPLVGTLAWSRPWYLLPPPAGPGRGPVWLDRGLPSGRQAGGPCPDRDLFPGDNVKMNGVKTLAVTRPCQNL